MLNVDRLAALHAVANQGSLQAAAEVLHVTTSAVSQQIAKLERETDQVLLEKAGRGVRLTDAGALLVSHTQQVISLLERAEADLDAHRNTVVGHVTIATFATAARSIAPRALVSLRKTHPRLSVELREHEPLDALPLLVRREIDLLIALDWSNAPLVLPEGLEKAPLVDDVSDIALPVRHRLARKRVIRLEELAGESWIGSPMRSLCNDWLQHTLRSAGHEARIAHTAYELATQLAFVAAGLGLAVIPRLGRDFVPRGVRLVPSQPALHRRIFMTWRADSARRTAIRATVEALRNAV